MLCTDEPKAEPREDVVVVSDTECVPAAMESARRVDSIGIEEDMMAASASIAIRRARATESEVA
jgi:hypothetical protein